MPTIPKDAQVAIAAVGGALAVISFITDGLALVTWPLPFAAAFFGLIAMWAGGSVIVSQRRENAVQAAQIASLRDASGEAARREQALVTALTEFGQLLDEGNDLSRRLRTYRVPENTPSVQVQADQKQFTENVRAWNEACRQTVRRHLPHSVWLLDKEVTRAQMPINAIRWAVRLQEEVVQKVDRMGDMQREVATRGASATPNDPPSPN